MLFEAAMLMVMHGQGCELVSGVQSGVWSGCDVQTDLSAAGESFLVTLMKGVIYTKNHDR